MRVKFYGLKYFLFAIILTFTQYLDAQNCVNFNNMGTDFYGIADYPFGTPIWSEQNAEVELSPYHYINGGVRNNVQAQVGINMLSGAFLQSAGTPYVLTEEAAIKINFPANYPYADGVSFDFVSWSSDVTLSINGEPVQFGNSFRFMPTDIATYVIMEVDDLEIIQNNRYRGTVSFTGPIYEIIVGGKELGIDNICFEQGTPPPCTINYLAATPLSCDELTGTYDLELDFNTLSTSSQVNVYADGEFKGAYSPASAPVVVPDIPGDGSPTLIEVKDASNPDCMGSITVQPITCVVNIPCDIGDLTVSDVACFGENTYNATFDFNRTASPSNEFNVAVNGVSQGVFNVAQFPLTLQNLPASANASTVTICDNADGECCLSTTYETTICELPCQFNGIETSVNPCDNGTYTVTLNLEGQGFADSLFFLLDDEDYVGSGEPGTVFLNEFPLTVGPFAGDGTTSHSYTFFDYANVECTAFAETAPVTCAPCSITNISSQVVDCNTQNGTFYLVFNYTAANGSDMVGITLNGQDYGQHSASAGTTTIGPLTDYTQTGFSVVISDAQVPSCQAVYQVAPVDCFPMPCTINSVSAQAGQCNTTDGTFFMELSYAGSNTSNAIQIYVNNQLAGTYPAGQPQYSVGPYNGDGMTNYAVEVRDAEYDDCSAITEIGTVACEIIVPCELSNLSVAPTECTAPYQFGATIGFDKGSTPSESFQVFVNGQLKGTYPYSSFPLTLNNLQSNGVSIQVVKLVDASDETCTIQTEFETPDCRPACDITTFTATAGTCDETTQHFPITVNAVEGITLSAEVTIYMNDQLVGTYPTTNFPVVIGEFFGDGETTHTITVVDGEDDNCTATTVIEPILCGPEPVCEITGLEVGSTACTGENLQGITIDFSYGELNTGTFDVWIEGQLIGAYSYASLPLTLTNIQTSGVANKAITIRDSQMADCEAGTTFQSLDCTVTETCSITNLEVTPGTCTGDNHYSVQIDFTYANVGSTGFLISVNGNTIGPIPYASLPITMNNVDNTSSLFNTMTICDADELSCCAVVSYQEPDCSPSLCAITEMMTERMECTSNEFMMLVDLEYVNPADDGFTLLKDGAYYGSFAYDDLPIMVGPFEGNGERTYELTATDNFDEACTLSKTVAAYNCMTECSMGNISVATEDCSDAGLINVTFTFESDNNSGSYLVRNGNEYVGTYEYAQGPLTLEMDGTALTPYNIIIEDLQMATCNNSIVVGPFGCTVVSNEDVYFDRLNIYTNTATDVLTIEMDDRAKPATMRIFSINGQMVMTDVLPAGTTRQSIDITPLNAGIYVCEIIQDGHRAVRKFHRMK